MEFLNPGSVSRHFNLKHLENIPMFISPRYIYNERYSALKNSYYGYIKNKWRKIEINSQDENKIGLKFEGLKKVKYFCGKTGLWIVQKNKENSTLISRGEFWFQKKIAN